MAVAVGNFFLLMVLGVCSTVYAQRRDAEAAAIGAALDGPGDAPLPLTCSAVVPCLLEHEAPIIEETLRATLERAPQLSAVFLTYNTEGNAPPDAGLLSRLEALARSDPRLRLVPNPTSTSKAANLNAVLPLLATEAVVLLDADHIIDVHFVPALMGALHAAPPSCCCMQGSVLIRGEGAFASALTALHWFFFSVVQPALVVLSRTGMFVGAGAAWRVDVLRRYTFDDSLLAEDDDLSMRVVRDGYDVLVAPRAELTELPPDGLCAFLGQRLRWAYGYEQSLNRHLCGLAAERPVALLQRLYPWYCYIMVFGSIAQLACLGLRADEPAWVSWAPAGLYMASGTMVVVGVLCQLASNRWRNAVTILAWLSLAMAYAFFQAFLTLYARLRMLCGLEWSVIQRRFTADAPGGKGEGDKGEGIDSKSSAAEVEEEEPEASCGGLVVKGECATFCGRQPRDWFQGAMGVLALVPLIQASVEWNACPDSPGLASSLLVFGLTAFVGAMVQLGFHLPHPPPSRRGEPPPVDRMPRWLPPVVHGRCPTLRMLAIYCLWIGCLLGTAAAATWGAVITFGTHCIPPTCSTALWYTSFSIAAGFCGVGVIVLPTVLLLDLRANGDRKLLLQGVDIINILVIIVLLCSLIPAFTFAPPICEPWNLGRLLRDYPPSDFPPRDYPPSALGVQSDAAAASPGAARTPMGGWSSVPTGMPSGLLEPGGLSAWQCKGSTVDRLLSSVSAELASRLCK